MIFFYLLMQIHTFADVIKAYIGNFSGYKKVN